MTTLVLTRRQIREASANPIAAAVRRVGRWLKIRRDRRLLQSMPDFLLADIGISRGEIEHATEFGRPPRTL